MISYPNAPLSRKVVIFGAPGIPTYLVELHDVILEGLPRALRQSWPERFYTASQPGADLSGVWPLFAVWMLRQVVSPVAGVNRAVVERVADGIETNWAHDDRIVAQVAARAARSTGGAGAGAAACDVAGFATWTAELAAKRVTAPAAAKAARAAAETAARAAEIAAWAAVWAAERAAARAAARAAPAAERVTAPAAAKAARTAAKAARTAARDSFGVARNAAWTRMADRLCGLMAACGGTVA